MIDWEITGLVECHFMAAVVHTDNVVSTALHSLLDESQQVFLIHARRAVHVSVYLQSPQSRDIYTLTGASLPPVLECR